MDGQHARMEEKKADSKKEHLFRERYGKWPSALELQQAERFLGRARGNGEE